MKSTIDLKPRSEPYVNLSFAKLNCLNHGLDGLKDFTDYLVVSSPEIG